MDEEIWDNIKRLEIRIERLENEMRLRK